MAIVSDLLQLCRLCLVKDEVNVPIFEGESDDQQISLKISSCLPVTLSQDDRLPQKICSECCRKLDTLYEFRNSSVNAEKQLVTWLEELENQSKKTSEKMSIATESLSEKTIVKEEIDEVDENGALSNEAEDYILQQQVAYDKTDLLNDAADETGEPQPKRAKRAAALKALIHTQESEEDEEDIDEPEPITKAEEESEPSETDINESVDDTFAGGPSTSADDQPGPSGVGKSTEGPIKTEIKTEDEEYEEIFVTLDDNLKPISFVDVETLEEPDIKIRVLPDHVPFGREGRGDGHLCSICGKIVKKNFKKHLLSHTNLIECPTCCESFKTIEAYSRHMEYHEDNPYRCEDCPLSFKTVLELSLHSRHHGEEFQCALCVYKSTGKSCLIQHVRRHENNFDHRCEICDQGFPTQRQVEEHKQLHTGIKKFSCDICFKKFALKRYVAVHKKLNHSKELEGVERIYVCPECGRQFSFEKSLTRHLSVIHDIGTSRKVNCPICHKTIANNFNLKLHMKVHSGEKNFICEECGKQFVKRPHFQKHMILHGKQPMLQIMKI